MERLILFIALWLLLNTQPILSQDLRICAGDSVQLFIEKEYRGKLQWQKSIDNSNWEMIQGATSNGTWVYPLPGTTWYRAQIHEQNCEAIYSGSKEVVVNAIFQLDKDQISPGEYLLISAPCLSHIDPLIVMIGNVEFVAHHLESSEWGGIFPHLGPGTYDLTIEGFNFSSKLVVNRAIEIANIDSTLRSLQEKFQSEGDSISKSIDTFLSFGSISYSQSRAILDPLDSIDIVIDSLLAISSRDVLEHAFQIYLANFDYLLSDTREASINGRIGCSLYGDGDRYDLAFERVKCIHLPELIDALSDIRPKARRIKLYILLGTLAGTVATPGVGVVLASALIYREVHILIKNAWRPLKNMLDEGVFLPLNDIIGEINIMSPQEIAEGTRIENDAFFFKSGQMHLLNVMLPFRSMNERTDNNSKYDFLKEGVLTIINFREYWNSIIGFEEFQFPGPPRELEAAVEPEALEFLSVHIVENPSIIVQQDFLESAYVTFTSIEGAEENQSFSFFIRYDNGYFIQQSDTLSGYLQDCTDLSTLPRDWWDNLEGPLQLEFNRILGRSGTDKPSQGEILRLFCDTETLNLSSYTAISDLSIVKFFKNLKTLFCRKLQLTSLDVSGLSKLELLDCSQNDSLTSLLLSGCVNLQNLKCARTKLSELDVSGFTSLKNISFDYCTDLVSVNISNTGISWLDCGYNPSLVSLHAAGCQDLTTLKIGYMCPNISVMDLSGTGFETLEISYQNAKLTSLKVNGCPNLKTLRIDDTNLENLDLSQLTSLKELDCSRNASLAALNLSGCTNLEFIRCAGSNLSELKLSGMVNLKTLDCSGNEMTALTELPNSITSLNCSNNRLTDLNLSNTLHLQSLYCSWNAFNILNIENLDQLKTITCHSDVLSELHFNNLPSLVDFSVGNALVNFSIRNCGNVEIIGSDNYYPFPQIIFLKGGLSNTMVVSNCPKLKELYISGGAFNGPDPNGRHTDVNDLVVQNCESLENILCKESQLTSITLEQLPNLQKLYIPYNKVKVIDASLPMLTDLQCYNNQLHSLNLTGMPQLTDLGCQSNLLQELNVTNNLKLTNLFASRNQLLQLNVRDHLDLSTLHCDWNPNLISLDVSGCTMLSELRCDYSGLSSLSISNSPALTSLSCIFNKFTFEGMSQVIDQAVYPFYWTCDNASTSNGTNPDDPYIDSDCNKLERLFVNKFGTCDNYCPR